MSETEGYTITRVVDAPRELVWQCWTRPEHFAVWFGGHDGVMTDMTHVSDAARQYAVGSQQSAAAAAQLTELAGGLRASIARFQAPELPQPRQPLTEPARDEVLR